MSSLSRDFQELEHLVEMAQASADISVQKRVVALFNKLSAFLKSPRKRFWRTSVELYGGDKGIGVPGGDLDPKYKEVIFVLVPRAYGKVRSMSGSFGTWGGEGYKYKVTLPVLPDDVELTDIKKIDLSGVRDSFVHELVHYTDEKRWKDPEGMFKLTKEGKPVHALPNDNDMVAYYNSPHEFNAHYQAGADATRAKLEEFVRRGANRELMRALSNFREFRAFVLHPFDYTFDRQFYKKLDEKYRRKFMIRLEGLYRELRDRTEKLFMKVWGMRLFEPEVKQKTIPGIRKLSGIEAEVKERAAKLERRAKAKEMAAKSERMEKAKATPLGGQIALF